MSKKIGTHSGVFHCDEVVACNLLKRLPEYRDAEIVRCALSISYVIPFLFDLFKNSKQKFTAIQIERFSGENIAFLNSNKNRDISDPKYPAIITFWIPLFQSITYFIFFP